MKELIAKWEKLEPERCRFVRGSQLQVRLKDGAQNLSVYGASNQGIIQAAVQEAIEARGWKWSGASNYTADVLALDGGSAGAISDNSFVEALLNAYLQVLDR